MKRVFVFLLVFLFCFYLVSSRPSGANVSEESSSSLKPDEPTSVQAIAGNVSQINLFGYSTTRSWQGYYGNVSGALRLGNSAGDVMYNWSVVSPRGQVYASVSDFIDWSSIQCFDMSESDLLEEDFNIGPQDVDGVNETFNLQDHDLFYTNQIEFGEGQCYNTRLFDNSGVGVFQQVLLADGLYSEGASVVFTSLLTQGVVGFDGGIYDFQMLVLEDGHGTNQDTTPYYFWVELG